MLPTTWQEVTTSIWAIGSLSLAVAYAATVENYRKNWRRHPEWPIPDRFVPNTKISVIIPARNEAANLPKCLASIAKQSYPGDLFEVIVLDDQSEDETFLLAQNFAQKHPNWQAIKLGKYDKSAKPSSKKKTIETGIGLATGELIVCTDADCVLPPDWLWCLAAFYVEKQAKFIAAPVNFHFEKNRLERFQSLDFLGMMGVTGAGFQANSGLLCNGANLAYPKSCFEEVGGFDGIDGLASGDDMLLLHKIAQRYPSGVFFLKNRGATALTEAQPDLRSFVSQRLRWASKSRSYEDVQVTIRLVVAFLLCWAIVVNLVLAGWLGWSFLALFAALFLMKTVVDFRFLSELAGYFERRDLLRGYLLSQWMHIGYIIGIGTLANLASHYEWKGRRVK